MATTLVLASLLPAPFVRCRGEEERPRSLAQPGARLGASALLAKLQLATVCAILRIKSNKARDRLSTLRRCRRSASFCSASSARKAGVAPFAGAWSCTGTDQIPEWVLQHACRRAKRSTRAPLVLLLAPPSSSSQRTQRCATVWNGLATPCGCTTWVLADHAWVANSRVSAPQKPGQAARLPSCRLCWPQLLVIWVPDTQHSSKCVHPLHPHHAAPVCSLCTARLRLCTVLFCACPQTVWQCLS